MQAAGLKRLRSHRDFDAIEAGNRSSDKYPVAIPSQPLFSPFERPSAESHIVTDALPLYSQVEQDAKALLNNGNYIQGPTVNGLSAYRAYSVLLCCTS